MVSGGGLGCGLADFGDLVGGGDCGCGVVWMFSCGGDSVEYGGPILAGGEGGSYR